MSLSALVEFNCSCCWLEGIQNYFPGSVDLRGDVFGEVGLLELATKSFSLQTRADVCLLNAL